MSFSSMRAEFNSYSRVKKLLVVWFAATVVVAPFSMMKSADAVQEAKVKEAARYAALTPEQKEAESPETKAKHTDNKFRMNLMKVVLKQNFRNPDSVVWEESYAPLNMSVMCFVVRAQNGFGGMNREYIVVKKDKVVTSPDAWNKNCVGKNFFSY